MSRVTQNDDFTTLKIELIILQSRSMRMVNLKTGGAPLGCLYCMDSAQDSVLLEVIVWSSRWDLLFTFAHFANKKTTT